MSENPERDFMSVVVDANLELDPLTCWIREHILSCDLRPSNHHHDTGSVSRSKTNVFEF